MTQSESTLEKFFIKRLQETGYEYVVISNEEELLKNLKTQLEKHNKKQFSDNEFKQIKNLLEKGSVFEKAQTLRLKRHLITLDNGDDFYLNLLNAEYWCQNQYQVTNQMAQEGTYKNRYDVTILINGLPLVQIELKRRGIELKEAFNQINRYQKHSFGAGIGLFRFVQLFVISNGVNTKYYSNFGLSTPEFLQTFHWTNRQNIPYNNLLNGFTDNFLEPCHLSKMICKYMVLTSDNRLMVLRPYQYYAVESIVKKVIDNEQLNGYDVKKNGYIWHTTGSGKTLTSFKACQILLQITTVKKVVFVVDRRDLDYQTIQEYEKFSTGSVSASENTNALIKKFKDKNVKTIVTTIQKLNIAISRNKNMDEMNSIQHDRMIFIFDECHRSQFGEFHKNITTYFTNIQLFGFTGTPILAENADGEKTTTSIFGECLHKYVITDAIRDQNVLRFSMEYISTFKEKKNIKDGKVKQINTQEVVNSSERKEMIVDYILENHQHKTQQKRFCAMMCLQDIDAVIDYYELFKRKKHHLKIATIFSYTQNEDQRNSENQVKTHLNKETGIEEYYNPHRREILEEYVNDFNQLFNEKQTVKTQDGFYNYYNAVSKKSKEKEIDILIVADMFLTGFDNKHINTLYVDKHLQYHGLLQAFSRTNRIVDKNKTQGNIICFRPNLKEKTDQAITLFSNKEAIEEVIVPSYKEQVKTFNKAIKKLLEIAPNIVSVDNLYSEDDILEFVKAFRELLRLLKKIEHYSGFSWDDLRLDEQTFADYKSKYLDIKDSITQQQPDGKVSILNDIDFELELVRNDIINVAYIIELLVKLKLSKAKEKEKSEKEIYNLLNTEPNLRSKKELIHKFIQEHLPFITNQNEIANQFDIFWEQEQEKSFQEIITNEKLDPKKTETLIDRYLWLEREPLKDDVMDLRTQPKPSIFQRMEIATRIWNKIKKHIDIFRENIEHQIAQQQL